MRKMDSLRLPTVSREPVKKEFKNGKSDFIGRQPGDTSPILYLSGTAGTKDWDEAKFTRATGGKWRCFSYAYTGEDSPLRARRHMKSLEWCMTHGGRVFMDSGAHSFHNLRSKGSTMARTVDKASRGKFVDELQERFILGYAAYIKECYAKGWHFDFYVTFDCEKRCKVIRRMTDQLFELGIYPVPVYHGDSSLDWVRRYIDDGHKIIGVGVNRIGKNQPDGVRRYHESVFNLTEKHGIACHGFAVTGDMMWEFPWYSCDSTTWLKAAAYGKLVDIIPEKQRVALVHVSSRAISSGYGTVEGLSPGVQKYLRDKVEKEGYDYDRIRTDLLYRATYNAKMFMQAIKLRSRNKLKWQAWTSVI